VLTLFLSVCIGGKSGFSCGSGGFSTSCTTKTPATKKEEEEGREKNSPGGVLVGLRAAVAVFEFPVGLVGRSVVSLAHVWQEISGPVVALAVCCFWEEKERVEREKKRCLRTRTAQSKKKKKKGLGKKI
jgi:hypothetical protein